MKVLFVVPYVPSQIYVRPYQFMRGLISNGHAVVLATVSGGPADLDAITHLQTLGIRVIHQPMPRWLSMLNAVRTLPTSDPIQAAYSWQPALAADIAFFLASRDGEAAVDAIHVEHLRGSRYALYLKELRNKSKSEHLRAIPLIWDSVDSIFHLFRQASRETSRLTSKAITRLELPRTKQFEAFLARQFDRVLVTSPVDLQAYEEIAGSGDKLPITVIPNGVDLADFQPPSDSLRQPDTLVISGKMSYHANVTMVLYLVQQILPLIWAERPQVKLWVVGKDPGSELNRLSGDPRIIVTGTVPDLNPYLQQATVAVSPIRYGAGIQNKVLQAMACATPVVCTPQAVTALSVTPGEHLLVADTPADFAAQVLRLLNDPGLGLTIGQAGRQYVETNHNWSAITKKLAELYQQAALTRTVSPAIDNIVM